MSTDRQQSLAGAILAVHVQHVLLWLSQISVDAVAKTHAGGGWETIILQDMAY